MCVCVPTNLIIYSFFFYRNQRRHCYHLPLLFLISSSFLGTPTTLFMASSWSEESLVVVLSNRGPLFNLALELTSPSISSQRWREECGALELFNEDEDGGFGAEVFVAPLVFLPPRLILPFEWFSWVSCGNHGDVCWWVTSLVFHQRLRKLQSKGLVFYGF